jgi:SAM-dependent methyltransferase
MGFTSDWLALREPADHAARDAGLLQRAVRAAGPSPVILDLGCGTGSTVRAMRAHLPSGTRWRLVDSDPVLLEHATRAAGDGGEAVLLDITDIDALPLHSVTLVTASALLDLVSAAWMRRLADRLKVPFYAALSYDGHMRWTPALPEDAGVTRAFNAHQRGDKGMGPALGPKAVTQGAELLEAAGFDVARADSAWRLGAGDVALQSALVEGIATAARESGVEEADGWGKARCAAAARTDCVIGHGDILAVPHVAAGRGADATG